MLIHQVADEVGNAGAATGPFALLIGRNQARLRFQPSDISRFIRIPESIDECAGSRELGVTVD